MKKNKAGQGEKMLGKVAGNEGEGATSTISCHLRGHVKDSGFHSGWKAMLLSTQACHHL